MEQIEAEKIHKEVSTKIKLPKEERYKIYGKMFINLLLALGVLIYFIFLNVGYLKLDAEVFKSDLKIFAVILLGFTIYFIEKAYKTGRGTYTVHAIELLVLSIITLYMPYVYFYHNKIAQFLFTTSSAYLATYYIIKCICMYVIYKKRYIKQASDVRDLIKEESVSYLDEESSKKFDKIDEVVKEPKKKKVAKKVKKVEENKEEIKIEKKPEEKEEIQSKEVKTKKTGTKKTTTKSTGTTTKKTKTSSTAKKKKTEETENIEEKPKAKRGRKPKVQTEEVVEEKPKAKRGRKPKSETEGTTAAKKTTKKTTTKKSTTKSESTGKTTTTKKRTSKKSEIEKE